MTGRPNHIPPEHGTSARYRWDYRHGKKPCDACIMADGADRVARRAKRQHVAMIADGGGSSNQNKWRYTAHPPTTQDHVAPMMVAGWTPEQARRIRGILLLLTLAYPEGVELDATPEAGVVAMIDRRGYAP